VCKHVEIGLNADTGMLMNTIIRLFGLFTFIWAFVCSANGQAYLTNGLIAYYPFNRNANDASGNLMNGIASGVTEATDRFGTSERAYRFDGSDAVVTVAPLSSVNLSELTLSAWVKPTVFPSVQGSIINKWAGYSYSLEDYGLMLLSDLRVHLGNGRHGVGAIAVVSTNRLSLGEWHHVVGAIDSGGTGRIWVNGVLRGEANIFPLLPPATAPVRIGQMRGLDGSILDNFNGSIDDVRLYNRAFSVSEVRELYAYEYGPHVNLIKAVKPSFGGLALGTNYQLQISGDFNVWSNQGSPFTATGTSMIYPQYWDVDNWNSLFFRLQIVP
jgi:hypothetical protein